MICLTGKFSISMIGENMDLVIERVSLKEIPDTAKTCIWDANMVEVLSRILNRQLKIKTDTGKRRRIKLKPGDELYVARYKEGKKSWGDKTLLEDDVVYWRITAIGPKDIKRIQPNNVYLAGKISLNMLRGNVKLQVRKVYPRDVPKNSKYLIQDKNMARVVGSELKRKLEPKNGEKDTGIELVPGDILYVAHYEGKSLSYEDSTLPIGSQITWWKIIVCPITDSEVNMNP